MISESKIGKLQSFLIAYHSSSINQAQQKELSMKSEFNHGHLTLLSLPKLHDFLNFGDGLVPGCRCLLPITTPDQVISSKASQLWKNS